MRQDSRGVTITELVVAMVILTMTVAAGVGSFRFITQAVRQSRSKTIAINLAQEKMEVLKNLSYFQLQVTTLSFTPANYPAVSMDEVSYTSETITLWGLPPFTRGVYVAYANNFGTPPVVSTIAPTSVDTGLKEAFVYVLYQDLGDNRQVSISNLYANPNAATLDATVTGTVCVSSSGVGGTGNCIGIGPPLSMAYVSVQGNPNWAAYTDVNGNYSFAVAEGTYTILCSSTGFFSQNALNVIAYRNTSITESFNLTQMSSGTVFSTVWFNPNPVISQVVTSSGSSGGNVVQWVELYNPTTFTWNMNGAEFEMDYCNNDSPICKINPETSNALIFSAPPSYYDKRLTFVTATFPSHTYYLIASTGTVQVTLNGTSYVRSADAYWAGTPAGVFSLIDDGGLDIDRPDDLFNLDQVGWQNSANPGKTAAAIMTEKTAVNMSAYLGDNQQLVRLTSTGTVTQALGNAYDTDVNSADFVFYSTSIVIPPRNSTDSALPVSGRPAHSALVRANDLLAASTQAVSFNVGTSTEYAGVNLINVSTGYWNVDIASSTVNTICNPFTGACNGNYGSYFLHTVGATITATGFSTGVANGQTSPSWLVNRSPVSILTSTSAAGWIQGTVYGSGTAYFNTLSSILVYANGTQGYTNSNGYYFMNVTTGAFPVIANFDSTNPNYLSASQSVSLAAGQLVKVPDIHLAQEGIIKGYVTSGSGALPNVTVQASYGPTNYTAVTDYTGYFYINVSTGTSYVVSPVLDPSQSYSGAASACTVSGSNLSCNVQTPGSTVMSGTFTVAGALGYISGTVKTSAGQAITTGVLIIASNNSISNPPPVIYAATAPALSAPFYAGSSEADGTYSLSVRAGSYNMSAYYPSIDTVRGTVNWPALGTRSAKTLSGVSVTAGQTTGNKNFTW